MRENEAAVGNGSILPESYRRYSKGNQMIGWGTHFQVSGLGNQEPGAGEQVQVRGPDLYLYLKT